MQKAVRLDPKTRDLVALAAAVAQGDEPDIRDRLRAARASGVPAEWVEELLLQSILMCGYPRALIAFGLWRSQGWGTVPADDPGTRYEDHPLWAERGERTCAAVYGDNYRRLRDAIRDLHPAVDAWMITEGYGRTMGRPGLDLMRRELINPQGVVVDLSTGEYDMLLTFLEAPQRVLTREQLLDGAKNRVATGFDRVIDVQVSRLRRKIEASEDSQAMIKTIRGVGYMFVPTVRRE